MVTTPDERHMTAWRSFLLTYSTVMRSLEQEMLDEQGLPLTWYDILAHLESMPYGAMRMQDLAESVLLSRSGLTRLIDRMAESGFVTRQPCPEDRRGTFAVITPEGRAVLKRTMPGHIRSIHEHFLRYLDVFDVQALHRVLAKVLDAEMDEQGSYQSSVVGQQSS